MERWHIGVNGYYGVAAIYQETAPWWNFLADDVLYWIMVHTPRWQLPEFWLRRRIIRDRQPYTWSEWYGDSLSDVTCSLYNRYISKLTSRRKHIHFDVPMATVMEAFGADAPAYWKVQWDDGTKEWATHGPPNPVFSKVMRTGAP